MSWIYTYTRDHYQNQGKKHIHHLQKFPCVPLLFFIILFQCDFPFTFHFHALEKEMATHSNVLAWRVPGTGEPHGLPSMRSLRVGHNWSDLAAAVAARTFNVRSIFLNFEVLNTLLNSRHCVFIIISRINSLW